MLIAAQAFVAMHAALRGPTDADALTNLQVLGVFAACHDASDRFVPGDDGKLRHAMSLGLNSILEFFNKSNFTTKMSNDLKIIAEPLMRNCDDLYFANRSRPCSMSSDSRRKPSRRPRNSSNPA